MKQWLYRLGRRIRNGFSRVAQRAADAAYVGPQAPPRLVDEALAFRAAYPLATQEDLLEFAVSLASQAYRDGFTRGYQWHERAGDEPYDESHVDPRELYALNWTLPPLPEPQVPREALADMMRQIEWANQRLGFRFVDQQGRAYFDAPRGSGTVADVRIRRRS